MRLQRKVSNLRRAAVRLLTPAILIALSTISNAASKLQMTVQPVFTQGSFENGVLFDVTNDGPNARGIIRINASGGTTLYPIELPRGARKKFIGYPMEATSRGYDAITYDLDTDQGSIHIDLNANSPGNGVPAYASYSGFGEGASTLEIGDDQGSLQFLRDVPGSKTRYGGSQQRSLLYVKPEEAPGRLLAYRTLSSVVLGPGSERLSDDAAHALIEYVIGGGRLIFSGGAVALAMRDSRWQSIMPMVAPHAAIKEVSLHVGSDGFRQALSVQEGARVPGSWLGQGGVIFMPYGLGQVIVVPFDLLEGPLKAWSGRGNYFANALTKYNTGYSSVWQSEIDDEYGGRYTRYYSSSTTYVNGQQVYSTSSSGPGGEPDDPFSYKAPEATTVGLLVLCYLILVAPINFLVLRKLRRSELAWFTTPVISVFFAFFILRLAAGLYLGKMTSAVRGSMVIAENQPVAIFRGSGQLFFPSGGTYDLKLQNVDWLAQPESFEFRNPNSNKADLTAYDEGQMVVPDLNVRNLQFKDVSFEQLVNTSGWFTLGVVRDADEVRVTISNHSPYSLDSGSVSAEGGQAPLMSLPSGSSATVKVPVVSVPTSDGQDFPGSPSSLANYAQSIHRATLSGTLIGFRPGPQVGANVASRSRIQVSVVGNESTSMRGKP